MQNIILLEWRGFSNLKQTGRYQFATNSDDSSWAWIEGITDSRDTWSEFLLATEVLQITGMLTMVVLMG